MDYPVFGKIINIHDFTSTTEAITASKEIVGENSEESVNDIQLFIKNIQPHTELTYRVLYIPIPPNVRIPYNILSKKITYKVSYTWQISGNILNREEWFLIWTGEPVEKPELELRGIMGTNKLLSEEERKKLYEDGLRKREIK